MDRELVRAAYDEQVRRSLRPDGSGALAERAGDVVRYVAPGQDGWSAVIWSDLRADNADAAIAEQVRYFAAQGRTFEWKLFAYDQPADLASRLLAAGLEPEDEEAVMVAELADLETSDPPSGVRLVDVVDAEGVATLVRVHQEVFGTDHSWLGKALSAQLAQPGPPVAAVVAMVGDRAVSSARVEFHEGTEFASLWGGGTLAEFRGRGIYRSTVSYRARLAASRGFRYALVDAQPTSRPILERMGFVQITTTTPYMFKP